MGGNAHPSIGDVLQGGTVLILTALWQYATTTLPTDIVGLFLNFGPLGGIVLWFMFKMEPRLTRIERSIDRQTRANLLDVLSRPTANEATRRQARAILREMGVHDESEGEAT